jgi:hypothetical protein
MAIRMKYSEPKVNQQNGSIISEVPRPNFPCCTYCHQVGHQIDEYPFIEKNVRQGFVEHF